MCGYQGWFRAEGDGAGRGWGHYCTRGRFEAAFLKVDLWPDVSEYEKTYLCMANCCSCGFGHDQKAKNSVE